MSEERLRRQWPLKYKVGYPVGDSNPCGPRWAHNDYASVLTDYETAKPTDASDNYGTRRTPTRVARNRSIKVVGAETSGQWALSHNIFW